MATKLTENFNLEEFACKDGSPVPPAYFADVRILAEALQVIRDAIKEPLHINSAYRTPSYNKKVGGEPNSQHLVAKAADLTCKGRTPLQLHGLIQRLIKAKKIPEGGLGRYPGFTHYDIRGVKARWQKL